MRRSLVATWCGDHHGARRPSYHSSEVLIRSPRSRALRRIIAAPPSTLSRRSRRLGRKSKPGAGIIGS